MLKFNHYKFLEEKLDELFKDDKFPDDIDVEDQLVILINVAYSNGLNVEEDALRRALAVYRNRDGCPVELFGFKSDSEKLAELPDGTSGEYVIHYQDMVMAAKKVGNLASFVDAVKIFGDDAPRGLIRLDILLLEALNMGDILDYSCGRFFKQNQGLEFLRNVAMLSIRARHPAWFDKQGNVYENANQFIGLDTVDSYEMTDIRNLSSEVLIRREKAAKSALEKKRQKIAATQAERKLVFDAIIGRTASQPLRTSFEKQLEAASFNQVKEIVSNSTKIDGIDLVTWLPVDVVIEINGVITDYTQFQHVEQFILRAVMGSHPDWFIEAEDGTIKLKRNVPKERRAGVDRITRAVKAALEKLVIKYGRDKVAEVFETVPATLSPAVNTK